MTDQCVAIGKMIDGIDGLIEGIIELSKSGHCKPKHCPIVTTDHDHYDVSLILNQGLAKSWICPFCGEDFSI